MQYLLLLYDAESRSAKLDQDGQATEYREFAEFGQKYADGAVGDRFRPLERHAR